MIKINNFFKNQLFTLFITLLFVSFGYLDCLQSDDQEAQFSVHEVKSLDNNPEYEVVLKPVNGHFKSGEELTIEIAIRYSPLYGRSKKAGDPVKNLQVVYDRILEVFIVSENLAYLFHTRPEDFEEITPEIRHSGSFKIKYTFPGGDVYRLVVCFAHRGQLIYKHFNLNVEGDSMPAIAKTQTPIPNPRSATFNGYNVMLDVSPSPPLARRTAKFTYLIQDEKGEDVKDLEMFMGTEMHLVVLRNDLQYFGYEKTKPDEGEPGSILLVPPIQTDMRYGTGIFREILKNGKILIEHGKVEDLLPAGKFPFKVIDPEADIKVEPGDWVEFWVVNKPDTGIVITRIEPLAAMSDGEDDGVYKWAGNIPIYSGPKVPMEHTFPSQGEYVVFAQFMHKGEIITSRFPVHVEDASLNVSADLQQESDDEKGIVKLSHQEQNGQLIYRSSKSSSGAPIYIKQDDGSKIDASTTGITCVGCHGEDGRGSQEGGVLTSDIRYVYLSKPYGVTHISGRKHPAYTSESLKQSISNGIDPAGNKLDPTMVRWEMSRPDLDDLEAYIHRLSEMGHPGVTDDMIRIGCILDISGPLSTTGLASKEIIEASFAKINNEGGIYGRTLKLVVGDGGNDPAKSLEAAKRLVEQENVFCFIGNLGEAAAIKALPFLEKNGIPLIVPLAPTYQPESLVKQSSFFLFPSIDYQARVFVDYIIQMNSKQKPSKDNPSVQGITAIYTNDSFGQAGLKAARDQLAVYGKSLIGEIGYEYNSLDVQNVAGLLAEKGVENVLVLTPDARITMIVAETDRLSYFPRYFCNNMLIMKNFLLVPKASERFLMAQNFSFEGHDNPNCAEFLEINKSIPARPHNLMIQMAAFSGVKILEEGLRLTGRDLTRKLFIAEMEKLDINTGLFGAISYRPGNHDGITGIYLVRPDEAQGSFVPVTKWLRPIQKGALF